MPLPRSLARLSADRLHAADLDSNDGTGEHATSQASLSDLVLHAGGNIVRVAYAMAPAYAPGDGRPTGVSDVEGILINGCPVPVSGHRNQIAAIPGGELGLNGRRIRRWGHLQYVDHGAGLTVHGVPVTGYPNVNGHSREIGGLADTNCSAQLAYEAWAADKDDNGAVHAVKVNDTFVIRLCRDGTVLSTTQSDSVHAFGGGAPGGGGIELYAGNGANAPARVSPACAI